MWGCFFRKNYENILCVNPGVCSSSDNIKRVCGCRWCQSWASLTLHWQRTQDIWSYSTCRSIRRWWWLLLPLLLSCQWWSRAHVSLLFFMYYKILVFDIWPKMRLISLLLTLPDGQIKPHKCCTTVSNETITSLITGFRFQQRNPPCVKAVV